MTTSSTSTPQIIDHAQTATSPETHHSRSDTSKPPFVPPRLTKHGRVAAVTQDGGFGGSFDPF